MTGDMREAQRRSCENCGGRGYGIYIPWEATMGCRGDIVIPGRDAGRFLRDCMECNGTGFRIDNDNAVQIAFSDSDCGGRDG